MNECQYRPGVNNPFWFEILKQDQQILRARRILEKAFEVFKKARQASRSIEKLRERAVSDYHALVQKAQSMELDEWSILRGGKGE